MARSSLVRSRRLWGLTACTALACATLVAWAVLAGGAGASSPSPVPSTEKVTLRVGWIEEPDGLNWFTAYSNASYQTWPLTYDFLINFGKGSKPVPGLASQIPTTENGGISADGKVWTYHLRPGLKWQDGEPLNAEDVAFTFNLTVAQAPTRLTYVERAEAVDDTTVKIYCSRPKADLLRLYVPILPKHIWEPLGDTAATKFANEPPVVGSGPFQIVEWKHGSYMRLQRNPYYWGKRPAIDEIIFAVYQNSNTMVEDLRLGTIDAAIGMDANQFKMLGSSPDIKTWGYVYYNWDYLNYNCNSSTSSSGNPVLRDWRFRNALNYAIDRQRLCEVAYLGQAEPAATIVPPGQWSDPDFHWEPSADEAYAYDLTQADALLTEAGYVKDANGDRLDKNGKPISLRLWATTNQPVAQTEAKLITGWLRKLGLKIEFATLDAGAFNASVWNFKGDVYAPDFDMYVNNWMGSVDPNITLSFFATSGIGMFNEPGWSNSEYDALVDEALQTLDVDKRKTLLDRMQQIMHQESPWSVLTHFNYLQAFNTAKWTGWPETNNGNDAPLATYSIDDYLALEPKTAGTDAGGGNGVTYIVVAVIAAVIVVGIVVLALRRRKSEVVE